MSGMTLTNRETAALRALADPTLAQEPGPVVSWALLEAIKGLLDADEIEFEETDPRRGWLGFLMAVDGHSHVDEEPDDPHFWDLFWSTEACVRTADPTTREVMLLSDTVSDRQWRSTEIWVEYTRHTGLFHSMMAILPDPAGHLVRLHCWRTHGRDFTERERFLLALARPHLAEAYAESRARQRPHPGLTPRQVELLGHVGRGLTNRQVARNMGLAEGTVARHLNNIYDRLGVASRTEAVTRIAAYGNPEGPGAAPRNRGSDAN